MKPKEKMWGTWQLAYYIPLFEKVGGRVFRVPHLIKLIAPMMMVTCTYKPIQALMLSPVFVCFWFTMTQLSCIYLWLAFQCIISAFSLCVC